MANTMHITAPRGILLSRLAASVQSIRDGIAQRRSFQRTVKELSKLNTRQLGDLGLNRSNLRQAAHEAVYQQLR